MRSTYLGAFFVLLFSLSVFSFAPDFPDLCLYRGRQLTVGQTINNCYANVTCHLKGLLEIKDPCPLTTCFRPSELISYRNFDNRKPYPDCCAMPICKDGRVVHLRNSVSRTFRPKTFVKRSPHVMGIKFP